MSKCIKCGRELNTGGTLEIYSGMCGKCYEEQYDKFVKKIDGKYLFGVIEKPLRQQLDQLKQQLAEKDNLIEFGREEIRKRNKLIDEIVERDKKLFDNKNKEIEDLGLQIADLNSKITQMEEQDMVFHNQLAIQKLEKVKELLLDEYKKYPIVYDKTNDIVAGALDRDKVNEIIDQQIKELKGEKDVKD